MRIKLALVGAAFVLLAAVLIWSRSGGNRRPAHTSRAAPSSEFAELRAKMAALEGRLARNEEVSGELAVRREPAMPAASAVPTAAPAASSDAPFARSRASRPTLDQQVSRFEKHFANLDALRGDRHDAALEGKFRELLSNEAAHQLSALGKLKIQDISCGSGFCKLDLELEDRGLVRMAQTEIQIQLAPVSRGASIYMDPQTSRLHAYFATGDRRLPEFPSMEEVPRGGG